VATVALNAAQNAGILAAQIIGSADPEVLERVKKFKDELKEKVKRSNDEIQSS
jgi:5-(carboxyamino)imidazole ribonucleotide mutase